MTALSIPERAREIAERERRIDDILNKVFGGPESGETSPEISEAMRLAMHSERELCAKELEAFAAESKASRNYVQSLILSAAAAKIARDGGK